MDTYSLYINDTLTAVHTDRNVALTEANKAIEAGQSVTIEHAYGGWSYTWDHEAIRFYSTASVAA